MAYSTSGQSLASFRERTEKQAESTITRYISGFRCKQCNAVKPMQGRKQIHPKIGYRCADCAAKALPAA